MSEEPKADRASVGSEEPKADRASVGSEEPKAVDSTDVEVTVEDLESDQALDENHVEPSAEVIDAAPVQNPVTRTLAWCRAHLLATVAVGLVLASAVTAASVYWWLYRPDRLTDTAVRQEVVSAAKEGTEALLSYSPEKLDDDLANAKAHLTGDFLNYYTDFTDKVVAPASRDKGVKTEANVARAAVSDMKPGRADVLVFVNQVTTSKDRPTPALSTSSVMVTLVHSGGRWLISAFNPV